MRRRRRRLLTDVLCPVCRKIFKSDTTVLQHLNQPRGHCAALQRDSEAQAPGPSNPFTTHSTGDDDDDPMLEDSTFSDSGTAGETIESDVHASSAKHCQFYPGAGETYGRSLSFMDLFNTDRYAKERLEEPYWPFSSKSDWEMGSWLLRSGLSMQKINDFLRLAMVSLLYMCS